MRRFLPILLFAGSLVLAFFCYSPGLYGGFLFDDIINIVENPLLQIRAFDAESIGAAAFSMREGISGRPVSMLSFALNHYFLGPGPYGYKLVNLLIHLLNGAAVYLLTSLVLEAWRRHHAPERERGYLRGVALAVAAAWLLHPLNLTGVLYAVQRMTSLSALFSLLGLSAYLYGRLRQSDGKSGWGWILAAFFLFTPLALLSKENGALLPAFMLLAEAVLLNFGMPDRRARLALIGLFAVVVIVPAVAFALYTLWQPGWLLAGYGIRDFTLPERLMTEPRVLWFYLRLILVPDITQMGLYHDDIAVSRGLLTPFSTLFAGLGVLALAVAAFLFRRRYPIAAFGILFFLLGHSIESSVIPLEIAHEHRNYLPMFGILLGLFHAGLSPAWSADTLRLRRVLAGVFVLFLAGVTALRATQWADPYGLVLMEVRHHPDSVRANTEAGYIYAFLPASSPEQAEEYYRLSFGHYRKAAGLSASDTTGLLGMIGLNSMRGRTIGPDWVDEAVRRLEHHPVSPAAVNSLMHLEKCLTGGICRHDPQDMARLLQAALRNPQLKGKMRSNVMFALSSLLFRAMHDNDAASAAALGAVKAAPSDAGVRVTFVKFLLNLGKPEEAARQIIHARRLDTQEIYRTQLDELEKLAKDRPSSGQPPP